MAATRIYGRVYRPDGKPAKGALVALSTDPGSPDIAASTDAEGCFHLPIHEAGKGTVTAAAGPLSASAPIESPGKSVVLYLKEPSHE